MDSKRYVVLRQTGGYDYIEVISIETSMEKALGQAFFWVDDNEAGYEIGRLLRTEGETGWVFRVRPEDGRDYNMLILEGDEAV